MYRITFWVVFILFVVANGAFLHRVPGLLGDEGSEGENVFLLQESEDIVVEGERSYIGPAIDYVRVPFVWMFGYSVLALRIPIFLFSIATFFLAYSVLRKWFSDWVSLFALSAFVFSPVYLTMQRIGWTITLFPFFAFLILWLLTREWKYKWLLAGFAAGLGLANHIIFLPTMIAIAVVWIVGMFLRREEGEDALAFVKEKVRYFLGAWPAFLGFWAGFGMQFTVLHMFVDDQGDPEAVAELFSGRLDAWWSSMSLYFSGSSYVARYTGVEFSSLFANVVMYVLFVFAVIGVVLLWRKKAMWGVVLGLFVHLYALLYVIDRFTLRYFVVIALGLWLVSGLGLGALVEKILGKKEKIVVILLGVFIAILLGWTMSTTLLPFLNTGGSVNDFSLGTRTNSAAAFVDTRPLIECLRGAGPVFTENVHIWNRVRYMSRQYPDLVVLDEEDAEGARWLVHYREEDAPGGFSPGDICRGLVHFRVARK